MTARLLLALLPLTSGAQTLFNLAPADPGDDRIPNAVAIPLNFGFDDAPQLPRNFFFGDSLSDTGNIADLFGTLGPGYPGTSFTNGRTWVAYLQPDIRRLAASLTGTPENPGIDLSESLDLSTGGSTTNTVLTQQLETLFLPSSGTLAPGPNDRAFLWAGGNDFLPVLTTGSPPDPAAVTNTMTTAVSNLTQSVSGLDRVGLPNITIISLLNLGLTPRVEGLETEGAQITNLFNSRLQDSLRSLPVSANLLWIDSGAFIDQAVTNPAAFGFTNITEAAAPLAGEGTPSTLTAEEQAAYLFYDDIHPTTAAHQQFAVFVSEHLGLENDAQALSLLTDSALVLDDRFGFENPALPAGQADMGISTFLTENQIGRRRQTTGVKADYDYAISGQFTLGGEFFYAEGDSGRSNFNSMGAGLDATYRGSFNHLQWETGLGAGLAWGDLERTYLTPGFQATSEQEAAIFSAHLALANHDWKIGSLKASWQVGLKQRFVHRPSAAESGAASLDLHYESETLTSTLANLELGIEFTPKLDLQLGLNPVLFHDGGEISASQRNGLATFTTSDLSGYDLHTARASLLYQTSPASAVRSDFIIGSDDLWTTNLSFQLRF